ncbi:MAG TPA: DUF4133 domain-containing protein [Puia sp.]|jgi:hypothetical protein
MTTSVYPIHRLISRPVSFRGIKGQYILLAAAIILAAFLFLILFYCIGVPTWLNIILTICPGVTALFIVRGLSRKYGPYGLMKYYAAKRLPQDLRYNSRKIFLRLKTQKHETSAK